MNILLYIAIGAIGVGVFSQVKTNKSVRDAETPKYEVLKSFDSFEIRKYPEMIMAYSNMGSGKYSEQSSTGFRTVASYIFGGNDEEKKIAMTSPVIAEMGDNMKMSFVMPESYALDDLPTPNNENVKIEIEQAKTVAVIGFGGFANDADIISYTKKLQTLLKESRIENTGKVFFYGYNPPYQLFNRTNEIAIEISNYEE
jgi:hypothetical protein